MSVSVSPWQLPSEVWSHVFGYLPLVDKLSVRASCKYFQRLVDHFSQWRDWVVVLGFPNGSYNARFWSVLRRRKVSAAVMRSGKAKDWKQLSANLPTLRTLVVEGSSAVTLECLREFAQLRWLSLRRGCAPLSPNSFTASQLQQLTHLSTCDVTFPNLKSLITAVSHFPNLTSLLCHNTGIYEHEEPLLMLHNILSRLPKLEHLSISTVQILYPPHDKPRPPPLDAPALSSLELLNYQDLTLPQDLMRLLPSLQSLAVFYKYSHAMMPDCFPPECDLKAWLLDLPHLSTLKVVNGPLLHQYVTSIPASVTNLVLRVSEISSVELALLAERLPNLLHLHFDPWPSSLIAVTARIPELFPNLISLKLRHEYVPEDHFLNLCKLKDLKYLEVLDNLPGVSQLAGKLQTLTNHRLRVAISPHQRNKLNCPCTDKVLGSNCSL